MTMLVQCSRWSLCSVVLALTATTVSAQWTNRYPKVGGYNHQIYLEGYELPVLTNGPMDPDASPDGTRLVFASRGWLWRFDIASGVATRITKGSGVDSRPAWSPDGSQIAFLRDNGSRFSIVMVDVVSGSETVLVADSAALVLDPAFSADGKSLFYSSSAAGDLDLWRVDLGTRATTRITSTAGLAELNPMPTPDGEAIVFLAKTRGGADQVRRRVLATGEERQLAQGHILSMTRGALHADGRSMVLTWPTQDAYELRLASAQMPGAAVQLLRDPRMLPLAPTFSADGRSIWFSYADGAQRMQLRRIASIGGTMQKVAVTRWDWGVPTGRLRIVTRLAGSSSAVGARLAAVTIDGHPVVPDSGQIRFDGQNGIAFFYSGGTAEVTVPAGDVTLTAVQGLATPPVVQRATVAAGELRTEILTMAPVWNARANGWLSGEHHFHLNYGGPYTLEPTTLRAMGQAEDLDVLTPMLANLAQRFDDQALFGYRNTDGRPWITWAQEVRSHCGAVEQSRALLAVDLGTGLRCLYSRRSDECGRARLGTRQRRDQYVRASRCGYATICHSRLASFDSARLCGRCGAGQGQCHRTGVPLER